MQYAVILTITTILLIPGIIMSFIPAVPGIIYMLIIALVFGIFDHFVHLTYLDIGILTALVILVTVFDAISGFVGAKYGGAHWSSIFSGLAGLIFGMIFIPVPVIGGIIGMAIGVLLSEFYRTRNIDKANRAAVASVVGTFVGGGVKVLASVLFLILFVGFAIW